MTCVIFLGMAAIAESPLAADRRSNPLAADLRSRIDSGSLQPSQRLPAGPSLAAQYAVSRGVVRAAVSRLRSGGLLVARQEHWAIVEAGLARDADAARAAAAEHMYRAARRLKDAAAPIRQQSQGHLA